MRHSWCGALATALLSLVSGVCAGEQAVRIQDFTGRGFAPQVIGYALRPAQTGPIHIVGPNDAALPAQILQTPDGRSQLLFPASLAADGQGTWRVVEGATPAPAGEVTAQAQEDGIVLANAVLAVRTPQAQDRTFAPAVAARTLPTPLLAFRGKDGAWTAGAKFLSDTPVKALRVTQALAGPVRAEVHYELTYADGGTYRAVVRVDAAEPIAEVEETYNLAGAPQNAGWSLPLIAGWQPENVEWTRAMHNGGYAPSTQPWDKFTAKVVEGGGGGYASATAPVPGTNVPTGHVTRLLLPDDNWGGDTVQYVGCSGTRTVGFLTLHKGAWRRFNTLPLWTDGKTLSVQLPIGVRPATWLNEVGSDTASLSYHSHDPSLPATEGRRTWALQLAPCETPLPKASRHGDAPFLRAQLHYGTLTLDKYKDYLLAWDDSKTPRPAVFLLPADVERLRTQAAQSPAAPALAKTFLATGDATKAQASAALAEQHLRAWALMLSTTPAMGHHDTSGWIAMFAEDALSCPELPADTRQRLLARVAVLAYLMADPDIFPKGNSSHGGPINMAVAMNAEAALWPALIPSHPMAKAWSAYWAAWLKDQAHNLMIPGGGWREYGQAYQMHSFGRVARALLAHEATHAPDLADLQHRLADTWRYTMDTLTPPDPRTVGIRWLTGGHNSPPGPAYQFFEGSAGMLPHDPQLAAELLWAWQANGRDDRDWNQNTILSLLARPWVQPKAYPLPSRILPGWGVVFRSQIGAKEQWLNLRGGTIWGHAYEDQGSFSFMSRGAIHVPWQPYQYYWHNDKTVALYNIIRFGDPTNASPFAWPDATLNEQAFGQTADYARISIGFPAWYINPGTLAAFGKPRPLADVPGQQQGAFRHDRQVAFLKGRTADGPTYLVIRDTVRGEGKLASWLNLNLLGRTTDLTGEGPARVHRGADGMNLEIRFLAGAAGAQRVVDIDKPNILVAPHNAGPLLQKAMAGKPLPGNQEQQVILRIAGEPGGEYHWVLFPRKQEEAAPTITRLAAGVAKISHAEGTDWVFLDPTGLTYDDADVSFRGTAAVVRQGQDGTIHLQLQAGGSLTWKKTRTTLESAVATAQVVGQPAPKTPAPAFALTGLPHMANAPFGNAYAKDDVSIAGGRGGVQVIDHPQGRHVRFLAPDASLVELTCGNTGIRGMGPFDLTVGPDGWTGKVDGGNRTLVITLPETLTRPQLLLNGQPWSMWWADDPTPWRGRKDIQWSAALTVGDGPQEVQVRERVWPALPPAPTRQTLEGR